MGGGKLETRGVDNYSHETAGDETSDREGEDPTGITIRHVNIHYNL